MSPHVPAVPVNVDIKCPSNPEWVRSSLSKDVSSSTAYGSDSKSIMIMWANGTVEYISASANTPIIPYLMTQSFLYFASIRMNAVNTKIITNSRAMYRTWVAPASPKACSPPMSYHGRINSASTIVRMNMPTMPSIDVICSFIIDHRLSSSRS